MSESHHSFSTLFGHENNRAAKVRGVSADRSRERATMDDQIQTSGEGESPHASDELQPGTPLLRGQYVISRFLNAGGFGITYLARDSLDRIVVIKECFPSSMCVRDRNNTVTVRSRSHHRDFTTLVSLFGSEARRLAKLEHPNIVGVHQVFEDNETAYMALDFVRGEDMLTLIKQGVTWDADTVKTLLLKLLDAVSYLHKRDILHRDISPDNILLDHRGDPVLIDFGAAREEATRASRVLSSIHTVKDGYSPHEFYLSGSAQGPASDLYALAATFYHVMTGKAPPDSQSRVAAVAEGRKDPMEMLSSHGTGYDHFFIDAMNKALAVFPKDRMQTADDWILAIHTEKRREAALHQAMADRQVEASIMKLVSEVNEQVRADVVAEKRSRTEPRQAALDRQKTAERQKTSDRPKTVDRQKRRPRPTVFEQPVDPVPMAAEPRRGLGGLPGALWRLFTGNRPRPNARKG
jgi:serine/threonine protein kinase